MRYCARCLDTGLVRVTSGTQEREYEVYCDCEVGQALEEDDADRRAEDLAKEQAVTLNRD